jgi:hypothetical protein
MLRLIVAFRNCSKAPKMNSANSNYQGIAALAKIN